MQASDREIWTFNFYRNSELHGSLLMARLARTLTDSTLLAAATRHCATEARHATLLSDAVIAMGGRIDPRTGTVQEAYSAKGGIPSALVDVLVLSGVLEKRVRTTYRAHHARPGLHPAAHQVLSTILADMRTEDHGEEENWIERALHEYPRERVEASQAKWRAIDELVARELVTKADAMFSSGGAR